MENDFNKFTTLEQLYYDILSGKTTMKQAKGEQKEIDKEILGLKNYGPTNQKEIEERSKALDNAKDFLNERKKLLRR